MGHYDEYREKVDEERKQSYEKCVTKDAAIKDIYRFRENETREEYQARIAKYYSEQEQKRIHGVNNEAKLRAAFTAPGLDGPIFSGPIPSKYFPEELEEPSHKETKGKVEGARYFYFSSLPRMYPMEQNLWEGLSGEFERLVADVDTKRYTEATDKVVDLIHKCSLTEELVEHTIALRYQAIARGKYTVDSYTRSLDVNLLLDAAARHLIKHYMVGKTDSESGHPHIAHFAANLFMIMQQLEKLRLTV